MTIPTKSEQVFEAFCAELGITCEPIPTCETKTPDYRIVSGQSEILIEIKQLEKNKQGDNVLKEMQATGSAASFFQTEKRLKDKIRGAGRQLRAFSTGKPTILVLFDSGSVEGIDWIDIKNAMFGNETVEYNPRTGQVTPIYAGGGRSMAANENTTISAVALLLDGYISTLSVFHNHFASAPIDPAWLRDERISHYRLAKDHYEWVRI